jgi:GTP cyclohydrolase II
LFSYVDQKIREHLERDGRHHTLDREGQQVTSDGGASPHHSLLGPIPLPRQIEDEEVVLDWYVFVHRIELGKVLGVARSVDDAHGEPFRELLQSHMSVNSILALPGFREHSNPLVRVHSCCVTGDVFGSMRCECGPQLDRAFSRLRDEGTGAVVYMSGHEGRGIGLWAKAITYLLQDDGQDTYQANVSLGLPEDSREFGDAAVALRYLLGDKPIRLLSNNPLKREHLERAGLAVSEVVDHVTGVGEYNLRYMRAKRARGHLLPEL